MAKYINLENLEILDSSDQITLDYSKEENSAPPVAFLKAIYSFFQAEGKFLKKSWQVKFCSQSQGEFHFFEGNLKTWSLELTQSYLLAVAAIVDAIYLATNDSNKVNQERTNLAKAFYSIWTCFLEEIELLVGGIPPYELTQLHQITNNLKYNVILSNVIDALRKYLRCVDSSNVKIVDKFVSQEEPFKSNAEFLQASFGYISKQKNHSPIVNHLQRAISRGCTALLTGATGIGKTESVKAACLKAGAYLVQIHGHPGLEDRQLFGSTYPDGKGSFAYVEGPLTEAWSYAAEGNKVVLLIDELARMDPYYHAVIIGALDSQSGKEIKARPRIYTQVKDTIIDEERYYVLSLPNGTHLVAPVTNLSLICTTNLGSDYQQATSQLDPSLLRRFQLQFDVKRLEPETKVNILRQQGLPRKVVKLMVDMEDWTAIHTAAQGSLLRAEANLGFLINWAKEAKCLFKRGSYMGNSS